MSLSPFIHVIGQQEPHQVHDDDRFFACALENACFAMGTTYPNPSVGAVIIKNGKIIAQGHTEPAGGKHAEKCAIANAHKGVIGSTLYVTLEPCCHFGRTPPCTTAIIEAGIKRVVYGTTDPNLKVFGKGIAQLIEANIEVSAIENPLLRNMAKAQILPFTTWIEKKRPFTVLKVATSKDNKLTRETGTKSKITGFLADIVVHQLRSASDATMIGARTARIDNPFLTARLGYKYHDKQPARIILSSDLNLDLRLNVFDNKARTLVITGEQNHSAQKAELEALGVSVVSCIMRENKVDLSCAYKKLADLGYTSILVEAGKTLFNTMVASGYADEVWWFISPHEVGNLGLSLDVFPKDLLERGYSLSGQYKLGYDELLIFEGPVGPAPIVTFS